MSLGLFLKVISFILHPVFIPLMVLLLYLVFIENTTLSRESIQKIILTVTFTSVLIPLAYVYFLIFKRKITSIYLRYKNERIMPLLFSAFCLSICYFLIQNTIKEPIVINFLLGTITLTLVSAIITRFWKISLHMIGVGGAVGVFLVTRILLQSTIFLFALFLLLAVILGIARTRESSHTQLQVYVGFALGFTSIFLFCFI